MRVFYWSQLIFVLFLAVGYGCSGSNSPVDPVDTSVMMTRQFKTDKQTKHYTWGLWMVRIAEGRQSTDVIPMRAGEMHLNALRMLQETPCADCLTIDNLVIQSPNELTVDLTLRHPYPDLLKYTGFDVRGIFISGADYSFPVSGKTITLGNDHPRMLNADGYTSLFNPTEFPQTVPPALGYIPGHYSPGGDLSATLNPFIAYSTETPRRMFEAGGIETRNIHLRVPDGPLEFGYAVDVCWQLVDGEVTNPETDFPPDANCLEAYKIDVWVGSGLGPAAGSSASLTVGIYDHQGHGTIESVTIESPDLFTGSLELTDSTVTAEDSCLFTGSITNEYGNGYGDYPLLVRVVDAEPDQNLGPIDAWYVESVGIKRGWARTWGGPGLDQGYDIAVDDDGNIYVIGFFTDTVDFDPGPDTDYLTSVGECGTFLSKFDSSGMYHWACTWGDSSCIFNTGVAVDDTGNVYITGYFNGTVDFDPGPGISDHNSNGDFDIFLSKFDSNGDFQWVRTWGGWKKDNAGGVAADKMGSIYVTGRFHDTIDFDPGPDVDEHIPNGVMDVFLSKFDTSGEFKWAKTWGGPGIGVFGDDYGDGVAVNELGDIYVIGHVHKTADYDPGPGVDEHEGGYFLSKFISSGEFQWAQVGEVQRYDVTVDGNGDVFVVGRFYSDIVDLDPGPGIDEHAGPAAYISKFAPNSEYQWSLSWGSSGINARSVASNSTDGIFIGGYFSNTVDFDPGAGTDYHTSNYGPDAFISAYDPGGNFQWASTWGDPGSASALGVAVDNAGNIYSTGDFKNFADFDPGSGTDYHLSSGLSDVFLSKLPPDGQW